MQGAYYLAEQPLHTFSPSLPSSCRRRWTDALTPAAPLGLSLTTQPQMQHDQLELQRVETLAL